jgi:xanthine/uracil/vitamin C permease (AzgA family)
MGEVIDAESAPLTEDDKLRRELAKELIQSQNKTITEFARHMTTVSFAAVGVVLSLKREWVGASASDSANIGLGLAIALFLASAGISASAASVYSHRVTLSDYGEIEGELHRVARLRALLTRAAFALSALGTGIAAGIALGLIG